MHGTGVLAVGRLRAGCAGKDGPPGAGSPARRREAAPQANLKRRIRGPEHARLRPPLTPASFRATALSFAGNRAKAPLRRAGRARPDSRRRSCHANAAARQNLWEISSRGISQIADKSALLVAHSLDRMATFRPLIAYRTQEVAGSSPASSIRTSLHDAAASSRSRRRCGWPRLASQLPVNLMSDGATAVRCSRQCCCAPR
jgi:hypothetical protein